MKTKFLAALFVLGSTAVFAQTKVAVDLSKTEKFATEVYKNTEYLSQAHLDMYRQMLGQITIFKVSGAPHFSSVKLSSINVMDKYNSLTSDLGTAFSPQSFNPLKYEFIYYSKKEPVLYYHVDNTDYYIAVKQLKR